MLPLVEGSGRSQQHKGLVAKSRLYFSRCGICFKISQEKRRNHPDLILTARRLAKDAFLWIAAFQAARTGACTAA